MKFVKKIIQKLHKTKAKNVAILLVVIASLFAVLFYMQLDKNNYELEPITVSLDNPSEVKPGEDYKWQGNDAHPKYIKLPTIGAEGYIQNVGVDQNQEVAVPNNVHMAGWFVDSVLPGQKGLSIIDGHVNGREENGIFTNLEGLERGAIYSIEFGNGVINEFEVTKVSVVDADEAASVLFSQEPSVSNQLNLITCGGNFDSQSRRYDKRVVVYSALVDVQI